MKSSNLLNRYEALANIHVLPSHEHLLTSIDPCVKDLDLDHIDVLFVLGLTSSVRIFHDFLKRKEVQIVFIEDDIGVLQSAIGHREFDALFEDNRVDLQFGAEVDEICVRYSCDRAHVIDLKGDKIDLKHELIDRLIAIRHSVVNHLRFKLLFENFFRHYPNVYDSLDVRGLKGAFKDWPIILCGAGPSLFECRKKLKALKGRAIVIGLGTGICALKKMGVEPDFCFAIDPNIDEFSRLEPLGSILSPLIYISRLNYKVHKVFQGPKIFLPMDQSSGLEAHFNRALGVSANELLPENESLYEKSSTAIHLAIVVCHYFGAKQLYLAGIDLCLKNRERYSKGVYSQEKLLAEENSQKHFLYKEQLVVKNIKGQKVMTNRHFLQEKSVLEEFIKYYKKMRFFNLTTTGLAIKGAEKVLDFEFEDRAFDANRVLEKNCKKIAWDMKKFACEKKKLLQSLKVCHKIFNALIDKDITRGKSLVYQMNLKQELAYKVCLKETILAMHIQKSVQRDRINNIMIHHVEHYIAYLL